MEPCGREAHRCETDRHGAKHAVVFSWYSLGMHSQLANLGCTDAVKYTVHTDRHLDYTDICLVFRRLLVAQFIIYSCVGRAVPDGAVRCAPNRVTPSATIASRTPASLQSVQDTVLCFNSFPHLHHRAATSSQHSTQYCTRMQGKHCKHRGCSVICLLLNQ